MWVVVDKDDKKVYGFFSYENAAIAWAENQLGYSGYDTMELTQLYGRQYEYGR